MGFEVTRFMNAENIEDFLCPICHSVLEDPFLIIRCEHIFCYLCINAWTYRNASCPVDRLQISKSDLKVPPRFFRNQYNRLKMKCTFSENGCKDIVQMDTIISHEKSCSFKPYELELSQLTNQMALNVSAGQTALVDFLQTKGRIKSKDVREAMLAVDRRLFCTSNFYEDHARNIGFGSTISAPHMHAIILEILSPNLQPHAKVLDIGSGSGYLTVCMALMLKGTGKVVGIDHVSHLVYRSNEIVRQHFRHLSHSEIKFICADGRAGYLLDGPYDAINIGGAIDKVPQIIIDQLNPNGRIGGSINSSWWSHIVNDL